MWLFMRNWPNYQLPMFALQFNWLNIFHTCARTFTRSQRINNRQSLESNRMLISTITLLQWTRILIQTIDHQMYFWNNIDIIYYLKKVSTLPIVTPFNITQNEINRKENYMWMSTQKVIIIKMRAVYFYFCIIYTSMTHYDISICVQEEITKRERGRVHTQLDWTTATTNDNKRIYLMFCHLSIVRHRHHHHHCVSWKMLVQNCAKFIRLCLVCV